MQTKNQNKHAVIVNALGRQPVYRQAATGLNSGHVAKAPVRAVYSPFARKFQPS